MTRRNRLPFAAAATVVLWVAGGPGLGTARAGDLQVNTYTTDDQKLPSVSVDADGDFVVVWQSGYEDPFGGGTTSIQGQRYASDGSAVGAEFQVNTYNTNSQTDPSVSMDADGDFVAVWVSSGSSGTDSSQESIQGQRYASGGSTVGAEFQVNTFITGVQDRPMVSREDNGDFVVVWQSGGSSGTDTSNLSIQGQRYASDGTTAGGEFQVNTNTIGAQLWPAVGMDADGDFVVAWQSGDSGGLDPDYSVQGQRYASDGSKVGGEFMVNTYTTNSNLPNAVSLDADGDFVVVWRNWGSSGTDSSGRSVQAQRYASDGSTAGGEFQVNTNTAGDQHEPWVALDADGDFVVVWQGPGSSGTDVHGQRYTSDGSTVGGEFQINTFVGSSQSYPAVAIDDAGEFVVVWQSFGSGGTDTDGSSVQKADAEPVPVELISFTVE